MKLLLGRLKCWWTGRHVWGRAQRRGIQTAFFDGPAGMVGIYWYKNCRRCGYGQGVKRRAGAK